MKLSKTMTDVLRAAAGVQDSTGGFCGIFQPTEINARVPTLRALEKRGLVHEMERQGWAVTEKGDSWLAENDNPVTCEKTSAPTAEHDAATKKKITDADVLEDQHKVDTASAERARTAEAVLCYALVAYGEAPLDSARTITEITDVTVMSMLQRGLMDQEDKKFVPRGAMLLLREWQLLTKPDRWVVRGFVDAILSGEMSAADIRDMLDAARAAGGASPTGRMAETQPAIQNIPIRTEQGRSVRDAFNITCDISATEGDSEKILLLEDSDLTWRKMDLLKADIMRELDARYPFHVPAEFLAARLSTDSATIKKILAPLVEGGFYREMGAGFFTASTDDPAPRTAPRVVVALVQSLRSNGAGVNVACDGWHKRARRWTLSVHTMTGASELVLSESLKMPLKGDTPDGGERYRSRLAVMETGGCEADALRTIARRMLWKQPARGLGSVYPT